MNAFSILKIKADDAEEEQTGEDAPPIWESKEALRNEVMSYMRIGGGKGGIYPLLRVQKNVTGQRFLED